MERSKGKSRSIWLVIVIIVLLAAIGVLLFMLLRPREGEQVSTASKRDPNAALGQIEGKSPEEIQAELNKIVEQGMFNVSINPAVTFESGEAEGDVRIENVPGNYYWMSVEIKLTDTDEVVYTSGVLEPNYHIQTAKLNRPLEKGSYAATAMFTAYEPDTEAVAGHTAVQITLNVLS